MSNIKKNIAYKGLLTFSNYIIGFITFPYITRVLGPENFGIVNFVLNTVDYFLLFATMGIATIGTREIASCRDNKDKLNQTYSRILGINLWFTILTLVVYFILISCIPRFESQKELFWIGSAKILFTAFAVEWFFTGIENFKYITIRSLIVKIAYVILVFLLVKDIYDYRIFFTLTIGSVVVNSLINFVYATNYVKLLLIEIKSTIYLRSNVKLGIYYIMTSMYITFNVMYLGLVTNDLEVGYYSTAVKLYFIILSLFTAFTSVMMPRMTALVSSDSKDQFFKYISKSYRLVLFFALPITVLSIILAPQIILVLSGEGYSESILPMRILMVALVMVWTAQVIAIQGLVPLKKDNLLLNASVIGAVLSIGLNILLTARYGALGSSIVLVVCEISVTSFYCILVKVKGYFQLPSLKLVLAAIIWTIPFIGIGLICYSIKNVWISVLVGIGFTGVLFITIGKKYLLK